MRELIGVWLTLESTIILLSFSIGWCELGGKGAVGLVILMSVFITMLVGGAYLIAI